MKQNERGITLIEVLASIVILSIIGTIIWSVFIQGNNYSKAAVSKNFMVQQSNIIMTSLNRIYQTSTSFSIRNTPDCQITITFTKDNSNISQSQVFNDSQMCFTIKPASASGNTNTSTQIEIIVNDNKNKNNMVDVSTTLYRLTGRSS